MTVRTRAQLLALFPDNTSGDAEPVDVRDLIDSLLLRSESGLVFLGEVVIAAAAAATFTSLMSALYDDYQLVWSGMFPGTNNVMVGIQLSPDNGGSWVATNYRYGGRNMGVSTSFEAYAQATTQVVLSLGNGTFGNALKSYGVTDLFEANTSAPKRAVTKAMNAASDGNVYSAHVGADHATAQTVNAIRVVPASGTLTGTFRLYGRVKA